MHTPPPFYGLEQYPLFNEHTEQYVATNVGVALLLLLVVFSVMCILAASAKDDRRDDHRYPWYRHPGYRCHLRRRRKRAHRRPAIV